MLGSFVFFVIARNQLSLKYRPALIMSSLVVGIAGYHYWRIFNSWEGAYVLQEGVYKASGQPFNDAYRYVDWLLTVPLLLAELVLVMRLPEAETTKRCTVLGISSALMIINGYPGETTGEPSTRWVFWVLSMIPFCYI